MPRMKVAAWSLSDQVKLIKVYEVAGHGIDAFDLCRACARAHEDESMDTATWPLALELSIPFPDFDLTLESGVDHPLYTDDDYRCGCCGDALWEDNDG